MANYLKHPFHLVNESPWPLWAAIVVFFSMSRIIEYFYFFDITNLLLSILVLFWISYKWWLDISIEGTILGQHTSRVQTGLRWGIILFIISEILFFVRFFWAFFHNRLSPSHYVGIIWPPVGIKPLNPFEVPLLNTIILLSSGVSITWAHHSLLNSDHGQVKIRLLITILLGLYFTIFQAIEYDETSFTIADSIYGSTFFLTTGFHGLHVIVGTTFLIVCFIRLLKFNFRTEHHFGFEAAAWYWHFVDVVWIFLFITIYWWGSLNA
jgi:cytochrome c oxidase subunit 3